MLKAGIEEGISVSLSTMKESNPRCLLSLFWYSGIAVSRCMFFPVLLWYRFFFCFMSYRQASQSARFGRWTPRSVTSDPEALWARGIGFVLWVLVVLTDVCTKFQSDRFSRIVNTKHPSTRVVRARLDY